MRRVALIVAAYAAYTGIYVIPIIYMRVMDSFWRAVSPRDRKVMNVSFDDFLRMDDEELTALLLSSAVACPMNLPKYCCPIVEFRRFTSRELTDWLKHLQRREKLALAARHYGCAKWHERH